MSGSSARRVRATLALKGVMQVPQALGLMASLELLCSAAWWVLPPPESGQNEQAV